MDGMTFTTYSVEGTEALGEALAARLCVGDVVALFGVMGAGKTAFVRGLARGLGCAGDVSSPTYALVHEYPVLHPNESKGSPGAPNVPLAHFDMYRVGGWDELESTGWFDYLDSGYVLAVEWSEHIVSALPEEAWRVKISYIDENTRGISIKKGGAP